MHGRLSVHLNHSIWVGGVWTLVVSVELLLSQKVVGGAPGNMGLSAAGRWIEDEEVVVHLLVDFHDSGLVAAPVAVVWRGKDRHDLLLVTPVVSLHGSWLAGMQTPLTFITSWWARAIVFRPFFSLNWVDTSIPNVYPAPRGLIPHP